MFTQLEAYLRRDQLIRQAAMAGLNPSETSGAVR
jgi:hypothetical protein